MDSYSAEKIDEVASDREECRMKEGGEGSKEKKKVSINIGK